MDDSFFRKLTPSEEIHFRKWARANYTPGKPVNEVWHPVTRDECSIMNAEYIEDCREVLQAAERLVSDDYERRRIRNVLDYKAAL